MKIRGISAVLGVLMVVQLLVVPAYGAEVQDSSARLYTTEDRLHSGSGTAISARDPLVQVNPGGIALEGSITIDGLEVPYRITGNITRSAVNTDRLVVEATDTLDNYEVVFLALEQGEAVAPFFTDSAPETVAKLRLYMRDKRTDTFVVQELSSPLITKAIKEAWRFSADAPVNTVEAELWHAKVYEPVTVEEIDVTPVQATNFRTYDRTILYRVTYQISGKTVYEDFRVRHYLQCPTVITIQEECGAVLEIVEDRSWSPNDPNFGGPATFTEMREAEINFATDAGDYIQSAYWGGAWKNKGSVNFSVRLGYSFKLPLLPLSLSFSTGYKSSEQVASEGSKRYTVPNSNGEYVRNHGIAYPTTAILNDADYGHNIWAEVLVGHYTQPGQKQLMAGWKYTLINMGNTTWASTETVTGSVVYSNY